MTAANALNVGCAASPGLRDYQLNQAVGCTSAGTHELECDTLAGGHIAASLADSLQGAWYFFLIAAGDAVCEDVHRTTI
jgi:hypothetical protein